MFGWFKKKEDTYEIKITRKGSDVLDAEERERIFLNKAHTCPECGHKNNHSWIRFEGDGKKYGVPMKCENCRCEWTYERPYSF